MDDIHVTIGREEIAINRDVFLILLEFPPIKQRAPYKKALEVGKITLDNLRLLSTEANVPYPLFFASQELLKEQVRDQKKELFEKMPSKDEIRLSSRGKMKSDDIALIVKDLGGKQDLLKKRILQNEADNKFVGLILKSQKTGVVICDLATETRNYFGIDLVEFRKKNKTKALSYLCEKLEEKNIFVSRSSHNFMPQNIDKNIPLSGICVKDKKFPFIFINTRDGDNEPLILETEGRQTFTLVLMLVGIGMNKFVLSSKDKNSMSELERIIFKIAGEVLLPREDLLKVNLSGIGDLENWSTFFSVTPSMLLMRLKEERLINKSLAENYFQVLKEKSNMAKKGKAPKRSPLPENGYAKYNGERFSREVMLAHNHGKITRDESSLFLFKRRRVPQGLFEVYNKKFS